MSDKNSAVGVFDSGLGGLTAIKQLKRLLPNENFIYFGDTGRVPYGTRSFETVLQYADDDMRFLMNYDIKAAVVACGTVSAIALDSLKENFCLPIIDAITPACKKAASVTKAGKVAVFATQATIKRGAFEQELKKNSSSLSVYPVACPMFVPLIEGGYISRDCKVTRLIAEEYLSLLKGTGADTLILGCTHYPIIKELIEDVAKDILGYEITVIDSGLEAAYETRECLTLLGITADRDTLGTVSYFVSDETQNFKATASIFLGEDAENVTKVTIG